MARTSPLDATDGATLDAVVLGGGISGAATARALAARGYDLLLVEPRDFAWGTSGRSSRLIHGGLRYLAAGQVGLVRRALRARLELVHAAPHLVRPCPFVVPLYADDPLPWRLAARMGVALYDLLARPRRGWPPPREIRPDQARVLLPGLELRGVTRLLLYHDGLTDDRRLTLLTALDAQEAGARLATRCEFAAIEPAGDGLARVSLRDRITGEMARVLTRSVVNATGPWCDRTRTRLGVEGKALLRPSRGAHLVLDGRIDGAALLRHPRDGRVSFLLPAARSYLAGTTTGDDGTPPDDVRASRDDEDYLRELLDAALPGVTPRVRASFAGLRPLLAGLGHPDRVSRDARVVVERSCGVPVVSLAGGKLTLHRPMARRAAERLARLVPPSGAPRPRPATLPGGDLAGTLGEEGAARARGLTAVQARWLVERYGSLWPRLLESSPWGLMPLAGDETPLAAEVFWAHAHEGVRTLSDLLLRFRLPEVSRDEAAAAAHAAHLLGQLDGWNATRAERERRRWERERAQVYGAPAPEGAEVGP